MKYQKGVPAVDKLVAIQTFALVAELGSFSKAAELLNLPNASVSTRVAQLEAALQIKLLSRTTRRVSLTEDGAAYLEGAQRLLVDLQEVEAQLQGKRVRPQGKLRVDVPAAAGRHVIAPALPTFFEKYPDIALELGSTDRPVDLIREGIDCVIRGGPVFDEGLVARPLGSFTVATLAAPAYLKKHGTPKNLADLEAHYFVQFFSPKSGRIIPPDFVDLSGQTVTVSAKHQVAANDADTMQALVIAGFGLAQLPLTAVVKEHIETGRLVRVLKRYASEPLQMHVLYPRNRHLSAKVRVFVDWVVALYGDSGATVSQK